MKVILLKDIPKVGKKFEVKEIADGHAINFLIPRGLAELATPQKIAAHKARSQANEQNSKNAQEALARAIRELDGVAVEIVVKSDERGHLFKKLRSTDVIAAIQNSKSVALPDEAISLDSPLSAVGEYQIPLKAAGASATITVSVVREK